LWVNRYQALPCQMTKSSGEFSILDDTDQLRVDPAHPLTAGGLATASSHRRRVDFEFTQLRLQALFG
jgi:hypothetical protein